MKSVDPDQTCNSCSGSTVGLDFFKKKYILLLFKPV